MKRTIIAAGESSNFQALIKFIFSETHSVHCVSSISEAADILNSRPVHLVISAMKLKNNTAPEFLSKLRGEIRKTTPFVILAGSVNADLTNASQNHNAEIIKLPLEPITFEEKIGAILVKNAKNYEKPDPVTGLQKKQFAQEQIAELLAEGKKGALLLINIDHYSFAGSGISKEALLACRDVLKNTITKNAVLSIANKHSFMIFVPDLKEKKEIENYGTRLVTRIGEKVKNEQVYVSIGLAATDRHGTDYSDLYQQCDLGLNRARTMGKNIACFYNW